ncbi:MAG: Tetratricopeptide 1 repeat-containing protein [Acidobacteria bacterium]|nr:Tetratricopeptide 1 repeat-containing protein [Acidobacteriota bacterium]
MSSPTQSNTLQWLLLVTLLWSSVAFCFPLQASASSSTADRYLTLLTALSKREYGRVIADSESLIVDDPAFPLTYEKLVNAAQRGGNLEHAQSFLRKQLAPPMNNGRAHFGLGLIQRERGDQTAAIEEFRLCLQAFPEFVPASIALVDAAKSLRRLAEVETFIQSLPRNAASLYGLCYLRYAQSNYQQALDLAEQTLRLDRHLSEAHKTRAQSLFSLARFTEAEQAAQTLVLEATEPEKIELRLTGLNIKGAAETANGNLTAALEDLNSAYRGIVEVGNLVLEENVHSQLASVYGRQSNCAQSLFHAQAALTLGNELESRFIGRNLTNVGYAYSCLGDTTEAINYYRQALEISSKPKTLDKGNQVALLTNIANHLPNRAEAQSNLEQALAVARDLSNKAMELRVLLRLGALHEQAGEHTRALELTSAALQISQTAKIEFQEGSAWNQLGRIHLSMLDQVRAMDAHRRALAVGERIQAPEIIWQALAGLAAVFQNQGNLEQATQQYRQAIETIEDVRARIGIPEDRATFLADKIDVYKKLLSLLVEMQGTGKSEQAGAEAFHYTERARARAFFDLLAEARVDPEQNAAPDLLKQKQELQLRIKQLNDQLIEERSQETSKQDQASIGELEKGLRQADLDLGNWLRELRRRNPRYAALKYPEPITLVAAQRMLDDKTILLSYSLADPQSFLFVVTHDGFQVKRLPSEAILTESVQKLLAAISDRNHTAPDEYRRLAGLLSRHLLPGSETLAGKRALVIVADGALHRLPFEVLFRPGFSAKGDFRQLPFLIRQFAISYAPSASVLAQLRNEPRETAPKGFIAFGDPVYEQNAQSTSAATLRALGGGGRLNLQPLPYSHIEIDGIAQQFAKDDCALFFGEAASEENVKTPERLSHYRLVHFSTHGYLNEMRPRFSGLVLSLPATERPSAANPQSAVRNPHSEDGVLSAYEIFNLKLKADLVVLSACETGLGKEVKGEGLMSLTRAFMYAGTPSVMVSLWNVNDETAADLMIRFYRHLKTGNSKSEALRQAQLETIRDNGFPFYWAPFVLVGNP